MRRVRPAGQHFQSFANRPVPAVPAFAHISLHQQAILPGIPPQAPRIAEIWILAAHHSVG
jgi:hypothetical protein